MEPWIALLTLALVIWTMVLYVFDRDIALWDSIKPLSVVWSLILLANLGCCSVALGDVLSQGDDAPEFAFNRLVLALGVTLVLVGFGAPLVWRWARTYYRWVLHDSIVHPIYGETIHFDIVITGYCPGVAHVSFRGEGFFITANVYHGDRANFDYASMYELHCAAFHQCHQRGIFKPLEARGISQIKILYGTYFYPFDSLEPDETLV